MAEPDPIRQTDASTERLAPLGSIDGDPLAGTGYRAIALIGGGAESEVYRAEHVKLAAVVVVKIMRQAVADAPAVAERMRLEAQALARLSQENLVEVVDFAVVRGRPLIAMEHLVGRSLKEELAARRHLPVGEAIDVARQILAGLAAAHAEGLVHRDIHPGNLFVCATEPGAASRRRTVKILDFGLLRLLPGESRLGLEAALPTADGITVGDPRYGAPEQTTGEAIDATADVYAVGAVLYRMVAGREPFADHPGIADLLRAKLAETPPPPSRFAAGPLPETLDRLVLQALSTSPAERPPSAQAFAAGLERIAQGAGIDTAPVAPATSPEDRQGAEPRANGPWLSTLAMALDPDSRPSGGEATEPDPRPAPSGERPISRSVTARPEAAGEQLLRPGETCGPYRIVREVGRGAMGVVYLAHTAAGEERAIKLLQLNARIRSDLAERFKREIQLLSYVDHVHVVRFYEAGVLALRGKPTLWVALEYLAGKTLRELRSEVEGPLDVERIIRWGRQIAQGVSEVHKLGVIHRDLKPENISIVSGDIAKVFDFGIAKYRAWGVRATDIHRKLGTLPYMSPEQLDGSVAVDARSDVFALGLILHELATGRHPFIDLREQIDMHEAILRQVTMPAGRLDQLVPGFPADLADAIDRSIAKRAEQRFGSMAELADALGESLRRLRSGARAAALQTGIGPAMLEPP
ncbi:MAG: serine/threonine protein kinase, partial [Deltaproteobacteria bacterium]|nr:serine/threonine protein kinase [Deltaproteobacteria bacterium]MBW2536053.1 serine/threonine protein kinase [Deltaproteobacteria bacterium]